MPKTTHHEAAEHHETAAKAHRTAAEHHEKGDHDAGHEHSTKAHEHSSKAHEHSDEGPRQVCRARQEEVSFLRGIGHTRVCPIPFGGVLFRSDGETGGLGLQPYCSIVEHGAAGG